MRQGGRGWIWLAMIAWLAPPCAAEQPPGSRAPAAMREAPHGPVSAWDGDRYLMGLSTRMRLRVRRHHPRPWIHPNMPRKVRRRLDSAFDLAVAKLKHEPGCAGLFWSHGADGVRLLESTLYFVANPYAETGLCQRSVAYSYVGKAPTRLCRGFAKLSTHQAATVLIHEALHFAGEPEHPHDPNAMPGYAISQMVRSSCTLF